MIISPGRNYIFVHIPKTGGTSLAQALEAKAKKDDILIGDTPKAQKRKSRLKGLKASGRIWKHSRIQDIYGVVEPEFIQQAFVFTIVRNPWDRLVSYYHWLQEQQFDHPAVKLAHNLQFGEFINHPLNQSSFQRDTTAQYTCNDAGVDLCKLHLRLESLDHDVAKLEAMLGLKLGVLPRDNKSQRDPDYRAFYTDADAENIGASFAEDIARFGYLF